MPWRPLRAWRLAAPPIAIVFLVAAAQAAPPLAERLPADAAFAGGFDVAACRSGSMVDIARWDDAAIVRRHAEALVAIQALGVPAADLDQAAFAGLRGDQGGLAVVAASGRINRAGVEAACLADGATRVVIGGVACMRLRDAAPGARARYVSFPGASEILLAPEAETIAAHAVTASSPASLAAIPADASVWLGGTAAGLMHEIAPTASAGGGVRDLVLWARLGSSADLRVIAGAPSEAGARALETLVRGGIAALRSTDPGTPGLATLEAMVLDVRGASLHARAALTASDVGSLHDMLVLVAGWRP